MNIEHKKENPPKDKEMLSYNYQESFEHIKGDLEDFIFSFFDSKKHSEK